MPSSRPGKFLLQDRKELRTALLFLLPLLLLILLFILIPVIGTVVISLFRDTSYLPRQFYYVRNYQNLFADPDFWQSFRFTLLFVVISVPLELLLGLTFALILDLHIPGRGLLRGCVLIPWAIPAAISARTWELIYNYSYGLANYLCVSLGLTSEPINWLGTGFAAFAAVVVADVWKTAPFVAIIFLAGLQAVPRNLYAQARTDGAGFFGIFRRVTLPLIRPVMIVALLFRTIDAIRVFDVIYVLTHGGPGGTTSSVSHYAYTYFLNGDYGYGSAISVSLFAIALVLSIAYVKIGRFNRDIVCTNAG